MNLNLQDKVFIVTGGASGIGSAVCKLIAEEGGIAIIADRDNTKNQSLSNEIISAGYKAEAFQIELTNDDSCKQLIETVTKKYNRIDGLVNNAGLNDSVSLEHGSAQAFEQSLRINIVHYFALAHYALPYLQKTKGSIVNVSSKVSVAGQGNTSGYAASKGGINALTREWAAELLKYGIRVNAIIPAEVDTPQYKSWLASQPDGDEKKAKILSRIPFGKRFTTPEEIAATIVFLLSNQSSHTTGEILFVDGGYTHLDRALT